MASYIAVATKYHVGAEEDPRWRVVIVAHGGTRRERGAAIRAHMRRHFPEYKSMPEMTEYSETPGFQTCTEMHYYENEEL